MKFYFKAIQVPELATLSKSQRQSIIRGAFELLRKDRPSAAVLAGLPGLGAIFGFFVVFGLLELLPIEHSSLVTIGGGIVGGWVGAKVGAHTFRVFMRPYYKRYIEGHQDEIKPVA